MTSQARIDANRRNAEKSTGPTSPEGKARSKMNRLTHGLRAETVVLPTESAAEFQTFLGAWMDDWQPPTMVRAQLVEDAAVAAWRKKRCVRVETARLSDRMRAAYGTYDRREAEAVEAHVVRLSRDPGGSLAALFATRAGSVRLADLWASIAEAAASPDGWDDLEAHHERLINLHGMCPGDAAAAQIRDGSWRLYLRNHPDLVDDDGPEPFDDREAEERLRTLFEFAERQAERHLAHRDRLPDAPAERDRLAELDAFAPRPEDASLLRAEAQFTRDFHRALNDLTRLTRTGIDLVEEDEVPAPNEPNAGEIPGEIEDSGPVPPNEPNAVEEESAPDRPDGGVAPNEPNGEMTVGTVGVAQFDPVTRVREPHGATMAPSNP